MDTEDRLIGHVRCPSPAHGEWQQLSDNATDRHAGETEEEELV